MNLLFINVTKISKTTLGFYFVRLNSDKTKKEDEFGSSLLHFKILFESSLILKCINGKSVQYWGQNSDFLN